MGLRSSSFAFAFAFALAFATAFVIARPARADCEVPEKAGSVSALPIPWRSAVDDLLHSTAEPGHPWSCPGGEVSLEVGANGASLTVRRAGEPPITRAVALPSDVVPLGQALFAAPLAPVEPPAPPSSVPITTDPSPVAANELIESKERDAPRIIEPAKEGPRLLLGGGFDGRGVGGSGVAWTGVTLHAGVPMGRWLPSLSLRQQSALFGDGPSIDELSVALSLQVRAPVVGGRIELRAGPTLRGAAVLRDLPRPQGEQSQIQGRVGGIFTIAIPVLRTASFLVWIDGDVVAISRETGSAPSTTTTRDSTPKPFPTFTLGGGLGVEVPL